MKKFLIGVATACVLLAGITVAGRALAGAQDQAQSAQPAAVDHGSDHASYYPGLWREGKAIFSDWKALDVLWVERYKRGYRPVQPILYSHQTHVEKLGIECTYCHSGVTKSPFATIPSTGLCMGCHKSVRTESPEIKKLADYHEKGIPVPWVSVNNLPEHVQFNHQRHLKAGVGCQNCHGQIQKMAVVERMSSLKMGFCISCHRANGASIDCSVCHY